MAHSFLWHSTWVEVRVVEAMEVEVRVVEAM